MAHGHCMRLHTNTQNMNNYCFSTATVVARTRLSVTSTTHVLSIPYLHHYARLQKINNCSIFGHNQSKVSCSQSTCAPITRAPVIADVCLLYESMTHILVSLSHRTTFSDLHIGYGGLEIKSQVDEWCSLEAVISLVSKLFDRRKMF
jgi:hypothetical protein